MISKQLEHHELIKILENKSNIPAIWRNRDYDVPITVTGYYGAAASNFTGNGILTHYVQIKDSISAIPLNEVLFKI